MTDDINAAEIATEDTTAETAEATETPEVDLSQPVYLSTGSGPIRNFDLGGRASISVSDLLQEASIRPAPGVRIYASGQLVSDLGQEVRPGELVTLAANKEAGR